MQSRQSNTFISTEIFQDRQVIFNKGEDARDIFIIQEGQVEIFEPSTDRLISILKKGHVLGEQALFRFGVRLASARARGVVRCQQLPLENVRNLLSQDYGFIAAGIEGLCLQLATLNHFAEASLGGEDKTFLRPALQRFSAKQAQDYLNKVVQNGRLSDDISPEEFIFIKVLASVTPKPMLFLQAKLNAPVSPQHAFMILDGEVKAIWGAKTMVIGSGAVFGLAESFLGRPWLMNVFPLSPISAQMFPVDALVSGLDKANPGIVGLCRALALKVVDAYHDLQEKHID